MSAPTSLLKIFLRIALPTLGVYCALVLYTFPIRLMEAENLGEEICLLTGHGYRGAIFRLFGDVDVEVIDQTIFADLRSPPAEVGHRCELTVRPGVLLGSTYVVRIEGCCGTPGIEFGLWYDPVLTPLRSGLRGSGDPYGFVLHSYRRTIR
jgi:hypothetical protein